MSQSCTCSHGPEVHRTFGYHGGNVVLGSCIACACPRWTSRRWWDSRPPVMWCPECGARETEHTGGICPHCDVCGCPYRAHVQSGKRNRGPSCRWHRGKAWDIEIGRSVARNNAWADQPLTCEACGGKTVVLGETTVCGRCYQISQHRPKD